MIKRAMGLLMALGMMLGLGLVVAAPASAGTCTKFAGVTYCGVIRNSASSVTVITTTCNFGNPWSDVRSVSPGGKSSCTDTDGFLAKAGYRYSWTNSFDGTKVDVVGRDNWVKTNDLQQLIITVTRT